MIVGVVISNLLYLIVAIAVAVVGALVVVLRHRKPKSVEANVASFHRGLRALAPDQPPGPSGSGPSWGGASRRAATTPSAFKRSTTSGKDAQADPAGADDLGAGEDELDGPGDPADEPGLVSPADAADQTEIDAEVEGEAEVEGDAEEGDGEVEDDAAVEGDAEATSEGEGGDDEHDPGGTSTSEGSGASETATTAAGSAEAPLGVDPVHLTSRKRRPSSGSASRATDEAEVPTEEAGTG